MRRTALISICCSFVVTTAIAQEPWEARIEKAMSVALKLVGPLYDAYDRTVIDPAARAQSRRSLRRLWEDLGRLANAKERLTLELRKHTPSGDPSPLYGRISVLQQRVHAVRESLIDALRPLPDNWQEEAQTLHQELSKPLREKGLRLQDIADQLGTSEFDRKRMLSDAEYTIILIHTMQSEIAQIIVALEKPHKKKYC